MIVHDNAVATHDFKQSHGEGSGMGDLFHLDAGTFSALHPWQLGIITGQNGRGHALCLGTSTS